MSPLRNVWTSLGSREELTEYLSELSSWRVRGGRIYVHFSSFQDYPQGDNSRFLGVECILPK